MTAQTAKNQGPAARAGVDLRPLVASVRGLVVDRRNQPNLKALNALLFLCVAVLTVRFGYILDGSWKKMRSIDVRIVSDAPGELREKAVLKKLDFYVDKVRKRDIFRMGAFARPESGIESGPSTKAVEATQNFRLVGISWSDDPDAMIEDIKGQKTFFVKKGQSVGDVRVESITKDKVVLRFGQELIEIR